MDMVASMRRKKRLKALKRKREANKQSENGYTRAYKTSTGKKEQQLWL